MDEIKTVKRLINLSGQEAEELDRNEGKFMGLARKLVKSYDLFENEKVKAGRLKTLLDNVIYKINFSYNELFRIATELNKELGLAKKNKIKVGEGLLKEIEDFLSENSRKKEY